VVFPLSGRVSNLISSMALCSRFGSELARRYGLFSTRSDYFYFEDVDLCLRYRQMVCAWNFSKFRANMIAVQLRLLLNMPSKECSIATGDVSLNEGQLSSRRESLPKQTRLRFLNIDRQLQCASLPALFALSPITHSYVRFIRRARALVPIFKHRHSAHSFCRHFKKTTICAIRDRT